MGLGNRFAAKGDGVAVSERIEIRPDVLLWARSSAGLTPEIAANRIGVTLATLERWESGELSPTIKQLRRIAKTYKRPLAVLLLPDPPSEFDAIRDYRRMAVGEVTKQSPELRAEIRRALTQREVFLELLELAPASVPPASPPMETLTQVSAEDAAENIASRLDVDRPKGTATPHDHLNAWIEAVESLGILVIQTRRIPIQEARGFSIAEWPYPVIALNGGDFPRARLFTLLHELTHLALRSGGVCDLHESRSPITPADRVEHFCNQVAASILMPEEMLLSIRAVEEARVDTRWTTDELARVAANFGASTESLLLRLVSLQRASWDLYWELRPRFDEEYDRARERQKAQQRESTGGPSYYVIKARDLGHGYVSSVLDAFRTHSISSVDVSDYLDVRFDQLTKLQAVLR